MVKLNSLETFKFRFGYLYIYISLLIYALFCIIFGSLFYRLNIFNITAAEFIVITIIVLFLLLNSRAVFYRVNKFYVFLMCYWILAVLFSIGLGRDFYFVTRQSVHLFYFLIIPVSTFSLIYLRSTGYFTNKKIIINLFLIIFALLFGFKFNDGHMDGAAILIITLLTLFKMKNLFLSMILVSLFFLITHHASHKLAILIYLNIVFLYSRERKYWPFILILEALIIILLISMLDIKNEFIDANALWRYLYWKDLMQYMMEFPRFFTGVGYGLPYIQIEFENFNLLSSQVDAGRGEYQLFTVPPHNSILSIFYNLGILPTLIVSTFLLNIILTSKKLGNKYELSAIISVSVILLTHNALELPYMAILVSYLIAVVMSGNYITYTNYLIKDSRTVYEQVN